MKQRFVSLTGIILVLLTTNVLSFAMSSSTSQVLQSKAAPTKPSAVPSVGQSVTDAISGPIYSQLAPANQTDPPDSMGVVGPTQFLFTVNGLFEVFTKTSPHTLVWSMSDGAFWGIPTSTLVSDPRAYYDRTAQRWFISELNYNPFIGSGRNNVVLLAISTGADLATTGWHPYSIPVTGSGVSQDNGCFGDYDTLGVDQNAIYIGLDMYTNGDPPGTSNCSGGAFVHSNLIIIPKALAITGILSFTTFYNVSNLNGTGYGPFSPIGVDSSDALGGYGYVIGRNESGQDNPGGPYQNNLLTVLTVSNPGSTTPTLLGPSIIYIPYENDTMGKGNFGTGWIVTPNNQPPPPDAKIDDSDDHLLAAVIRNGHLWTAHTVSVNQSGNSNSGNPDRDAVRWYDINLSNLTLNQSGIVFDNSANANSNWAGTLMVSGQGHVAMGFNTAGLGLSPVAKILGRLASDPPNYMTRLHVVYQTSTNDHYDDFFGPYNRWGDYSYTSLDPCDDMTMWTVQEYIAGSLDNQDWGVSAAKIKAPSPTILPGSSVATVATGKSAVSLSLTGTAPSGEGFYDTPNSADASCRTRLSATVTNGVFVSSVTYIDPLHVNLTLNTVGASAGTATVTITNPDGQTSATYITLIAPSGPAIDTIGVFRSGTFLLRLHNSTGNADITATFNPATKPYPVVGDWTGAGFDTIGVLNQNNGLFSLGTANDTTACANSGNVIQLVLGNANDMSLAGLWTAGAAHAGVGVFRPSNGLIYFKNSLTTGYADYQMVLGVPGDVGLAGDWNGDGIDSPGVYRPSNSTFYLTDTVCNCTPTANYQFQYGVGGDAPVIGDWVPSQTHDGVGLFRQTNGFTYLKNSLTTGYADNTFTYGIAGDVPVAGHWQLTYPPEPPPINTQTLPILVPHTPIPNPTSQPAETGGLQD